MARCTEKGLTMKRYLLLSLLVVAFLSCKKNASPPPSIAGNWELKVQPFSSYSFPDPIRIKFTGNNYERYVAGVLDKSGTFTITKDQHGDNPKANRIILDNDLGVNKSFYSIEGKQLRLSADPFLAASGIIPTLYERTN